MHAISHQQDTAEPLLPTHPITSQKSSMTYGTTTETAALNQVDHFPAANWTRSRCDTRKRRFPQTIAHRGYKAAFPENTMRAFQGAVEVGAHALETDIHLSKDGEVVLSHDPDLKRCFGKTEKIIECDWQSLSQLRTIREPHAPMPRLRDLLEYIAQPEQQHIWILLDIKLDNDADQVMQRISEVLQLVDSGGRAWNHRVILGVWAAKYLVLAQKYLPGFSVSYIGFSTTYARQFLQVPNISFNMLQRVLPGPVGLRFIKDLKAADRQHFVWTVNEANLMRWSIQKEVDGVITDDPKQFNEICNGWRDDEPLAQPSWFQWLYTFWLFFIIFMFSIRFRRKFPEPVEKIFVRSQDLRAKASLSFGA